MSNYIGSVWRKWDLHVHTPYSILNNGFGEDWDLYVQTLFKKAIEKNIAAIGITDYFTIDGYKKIKSDYLNNPLKLKELFSDEEVEKIKSILVIPNIEFRLDKIVHKGRVNFHVIFSNELEDQVIEENFLHDLDFVYEGNVFGSDEEHKLKTANLRELGKKLKEEHEKFKSVGTDLFVGMMNAVVKDEQISALLSKSKFKDKYLICVAADEDLSEIDWNGQDHLVRKVLIQKSNALFSGNPKTNSWSIANNDKEKGKKFIAEFKSLKPCFWGSDSHTFDELFEPSLKRYLWIKSNPTFEGLRQTIFEPSLRVKVQERNPEKDSQKLSISSIEISDARGFPIQDEIIYFNRDLVCIIGGRGAGKSSLLETLAYCFDKHISIPNPKNKLENIQFPFIQNYQLKEGTNAIFKLKYNDLDGNIVEEENIELKNRTHICALPVIYLGQNQIENISANKQAIHQLTFKTVIQSSESLDNINEIENNIKSLEAQLVADNKEVESIRLLYKDFNLDKKKEEREKIIKELALLESNETRLILKELDAIRIKRDLYLKVKANSQKFNNLTSVFQNNINLIVNETNESLNQFDLNRFQLGTIDFSRNIEQYDTALKEIEKLEIEKEYLSTTKKVQLALNSLTDFSVSYIEAMKSKVELIDNEIKRYFEDVKYLEFNNNSRISSLEHMVECYKEYVDLYNAEITQFTLSNKGVLKSLKLQSNYIFDLAKLFNSLYELVDKRKVRTIQKFLEIVTDGGRFKYGEYANWVKQFTSSSEIRDLFYDYNATQVDEILFKNYFELNTSIQYEIEPGKLKILDELSLGQKGTVLLKLLLSSGNNCPIIIDQPEDHLDNDFIYSDLVSTIRSVKEKRQIIIVSHDANLVVNGDAEQIIVAKYENGKITHNSAGSIENLEIRTKATKILEGGDEAFKNREKKYY